MSPAPKPQNYSVTGAALESFELVVPPECAGQRLDQALSHLLPEFSRTRLAHWVRTRRVELNGRPALPKSKVWGGEKILLSPVADPAATAAAPEAIALDIVHEDAAVLVIVKPAGLVVHPGSGNWSGTLMNALLAHASQLATLPRAGIVHRLDKNTSGLLVVAKTLEAQTSLVRQLQAHTVKREYLALVHGRIARDGKAEAPIGRHPVQRTRMAVVARGSPPSRIIRCCSTSHTRRCCAAGSKPGAPTRFACICKRSVTRWSETRSMAKDSAARMPRYPAFRARHCTPSGLNSSTLRAAKQSHGTHPCLPICANSSPRSKPVSRSRREASA